MAPQKIIIDTDPGIDDVLALLLAFATGGQELHVLLVSLCHGNTTVENCLRNAVSMFNVMEKEMIYRKENGLQPGFESLVACKPILAVGAATPLEDQEVMEDGFHGIDGLGGIHEKAPHLSPQGAWREVFNKERHSPPSPTNQQDTLPKHNYTPSTNPAHIEILRILRENEPGTVTVIAIGPLTNIALAAEEDVETLLRMKELVIMGGAIDAAGNATPVAEFNIWADARAAARVFALTSPIPSSTMPPLVDMKPYPEPLSKQLEIVMFPWDLTTKLLLSEKKWESIVAPLMEKKSPLAEWMNMFIGAAFRKMEAFYKNDGDENGFFKEEGVTLCLNDPICVWYLMKNRATDMFSIVSYRDVRVESLGQWTRGMTVVDRRNKNIAAESAEDGVIEELDHDSSSWLHPKRGNRVAHCTDCKDKDLFGDNILKVIFQL